MGIQVAVHHVTRYRFDRPVALSPHVLRLRPAPHSRTPVDAYSLRVEPRDHFVNWQQDPFGNFLARLVFPRKATELAIEVDLIADLTVINPFDFFLEDAAAEHPFEYDPRLRQELAPYLDVRERGPLLERWLRGVDRERRRTVDFLVDLNRRLSEDVAYTIRFEPGVQTCEETLEKRTGSCRDSGWLLVQVLRHLGLAARFVSGYLVQLAPDDRPLGGPAGPDRDFTDLHAWAEVYVPGAGWIGLDPTSGLFAGEGHIPLAATPDPASAAPVDGSTDPCEVEFAYANEVRRVDGLAQPSSPYPESEWQAILTLGDAIDADLAAHDVRLTMGGEPTFVSIDDRDGPEWTTEALGPVKRKMAEQLARRLRERFAPGGGLLFFGQGKWYPGEVLPRWALGCYWRDDGVPVWRDPALIADRARPAGHGVGDAKRFISALCHRLELSERLVLAGWEDVLYYLWKEQSLPPNVDPERASVDEPQERQELARVLERGLGTVTGFALPLKWQTDSAGNGHWWSSRWEFRRDRMVLVPGSSPMGYRLPLESLARVAPERRVVDHERCSFAARGPLPERKQQASARGAPQLALVEQSLPASDDFTSLVRTALCVEPRDGTLHVFLPPLTHVEHFLVLVEEIEATAQELGMAVVIEGYEPPRDPRLRRFQITPDPGVIEVNIHPADGWRSLVDIHSTVYEEARQCRLGTEKFMLDGRTTGTGGGNHVTVGSAAPADSPLLRRPDLLASLVAYWQHHPSLSYLFSGLFLGPTSQAPRVDEARHESLYELEIAMGLCPGKDAATPPWLVDRLYRHLLVDVTGNPHRTEFCIDKLYSPDGPAGRLGLLEMRAFEMPPNARMSLAQLLLVRGLIARFWQQPYAKPLVRWGTELHDRFMLPHFLWQDFADVLSELRESGYAFPLDWYTPFLEWRFPRLGTVSVRDLELELRTAVEPWHVLGEEVTSLGTARFVDSSLERIQIKVMGMTEGRHVLTCNRRRVPLRPTGTRSEYVAGVRYRAWQPPSALHPTIGVHSPLVVDVVDTWAGRSIGGCTYHVAHPGGRSFDTFPVNANEAESRRIARFWSWGHTPGTVSLPERETNSEYPHTLDLRRPAGL
jgi:uncharacterized protein (DUF2126 family)/transglutaminase-like putative cysteine protease